MKIAIIGNAGSGKSTLAAQLGTMLNLPVYHLDQYFWLPGWREPDRQEFATIHNQLCDREAWIIDGIATSFFEYRIAQADVVVFMDIPPIRCLYRVLARTMRQFGKVRKCSAPGCPERIPDYKFLRFILTFNRIRRPMIETLLQKYAGHKKILVLRNDLDIQMIAMRYFLEDIGKSSAMR